MAITDFNAGKFKSGTQAVRAYGALHQLFTIAWVASSHDELLTSMNSY